MATFDTIKANPLLFLRSFKGQNSSFLQKNVNYSRMFLIKWRILVSFVLK